MGRKKAKSAERDEVTHDTVPEPAPNPHSCVVSFIPSQRLFSSPPFPLPLAVSMGSNATVPRAGRPPQGDRPGSVHIIRPLTPRLVTGQRGAGLERGGERGGRSHRKPSDRTLPPSRACQHGEEGVKDVAAWSGS